MNPLIIGHRGAAAVAPENTFASFNRALADGADGIEFDVRLTSDGIPICIHDETLKRTARADVRVCDLTVKEIMNYEVGSWFNDTNPLHAAGSYAGEKIPRLEQVLLWGRERNCLLYVELKTERNNAYTLAAQTVRLLQRHSITENVIIESFDLAAVRAVKQINSAIKTAALFERTVRRFVPTNRYILNAVRDCYADEIALHYTLATPKIVAEAVHENRGVVIWTVDDTAWLERARTRRIKAIITNDPAKFVTLISN